MNLNEFVNCLTSGKFDEQLSVLYGYTDMCVLRSRARYLSAAERFSRLYPKCGDIRVFSAPEYADIAGDCKILGNGSLLAAAVGRDIAAFAANNNNNNINVKFPDKSEIAVDLDDLSPKAGECGTLAAIVRGTAAVLAESGAELGGLDVFVSAENDSSAIPHDVFAVLMTYVMNSFFNGGKLKRDEIAETAKKVQSEYFGVSANGIGYLLSAEGGFVFADFKNEEEPDVKPVEFDFSKAGYSLCITDTSGGETAESSTDTELGYMKSVADVLGFEKLSNAEIDDFYKKLPDIRKKCGDRAVLRAAYYLSENYRARQEVEALDYGDSEEFFRIVNESGSTASIVYQCGEDLSALMISRRFLGDTGAVRVQGTNTVQAFVPTYLAEEYSAEMERCFGLGSCNVLSLRKLGICELIAE